MKVVNRAIYGVLFTGGTARVVTHEPSVVRVVRVSNWRVPLEMPWHVLKGTEGGGLSD